MIERAIDTLDIVVDGFGRSGTLRYLSAFSVAERLAISATLDGNQFFDEYRRVRLLVVGFLRELKHKSLRSSEFPLDETILVGTPEGIDPQDLVEPMVRTLVPFVELALPGDWQRIRIIVPCNTLSGVVRRVAEVLGDSIELQQTVRGDPDVNGRDIARAVSASRITFPDLPAIALSAAIGPTTRLVRVLGTRLAEQAYRSALSASWPGLECHSWQDVESRSFTDVLQATIAGATLLPAPKLGLDEVGITACTDVHCPGFVDSVSALADEMVSESYGVSPGKGALGIRPSSDA